MNLQLMKTKLVNLNKLLEIYSSKFLLSILIFIILLISVACSETTSTSYSFELTLYETKDYSDGQKYVFNPEDKKPTVVNFWFPSCPPCISEMPDIDSIYLEYKNHIDVIGIQLIGIDSVSDGKRFVSEGEFSYAIGGDLEGDIVVRYDVALFPTTLFIDQTGTVVKSWQGIITKPEMEKIINSMINVED